MTTWALFVFGVLVFLSTAARLGLKSTGTQVNHTTVFHMNSSQLGASDPYCHIFSKNYCGFFSKLEKQKSKSKMCLLLYSPRVLLPNLCPCLLQFIIQHIQPVQSVSASN